MDNNSTDEETLAYLEQLCMKNTTTSDNFKAMSSAIKRITVPG